MSTDTPANTLPNPSEQAAPEAPVLERRDEQGGAKFKRSI